MDSEFFHYFVILHSQVQESIRLTKMKQCLEEDLGEQISVEVWAQAAGQSAKSLQQTLKLGDEARGSLGKKADDTKDINDLARSGCSRS